MVRVTNILCFCLLYCFLCSNTFYAQEVNSSFGGIDERLLIESRWRYTYTLHVESNTIVHKAENNYDYYLYFKYNYSYQEFLNGELKKGWWQLDNRTLDYSFRNVDEFEIVNLNKGVLIMEFNQKNSKGTYQYHFVRVNSDEAPFVKPPNELPDVLVEALNPRKEKRIKKKEKKGGWFAFLRRKPSKYDIEKDWTPINIELTGGGYYGGIDPVLKDIIHIKNNGRLIKEFHSVYNGQIVTKKNIPREELEQFAEYIVKQKFFEMERVYDCESPTCYKRKKMEPKPMPLRLSIIYGDQAKIITIGIWGKDKYGVKYVDYPPALDNIIDAIQRMANRLEDPVVRK